MSEKLKTSSIAVLVLAGLFAADSTRAGEEKRFDPEKCFPLECLGYLRIRSGADLAAALGDTLPGRIASDPEVHAALGSLPGMARVILSQASGPLVELTGHDSLGLLDLLRGEIAISIVGLDPAAKVSVLAALELGAQRESILEVVKKITAGLTRAAGRPLPEIEVAGRKTVAWPILNGMSMVIPLALGTHLVFASSRDALQGAAEAFDGAPGGEDFSLAANPRCKEAIGALGLERPSLLGFINFEAIRGLAMLGISRDPNSKEMVKTLRSTGLLTITTLGLSLGTRGGGLEAKLLLGTQGGEGRGLLGELLGSLTPPAGSGDALGLIPTEASFVGGVGGNFGKALRAIHALPPDAFPPELNGWIRKIEERSGLSLEKDIFTLGRIELWSFAVAPPAGGLPDILVLARTAELAPYRVVMEKLHRALGKEPRLLPGPAAAGGGGPSITYLRAGSVFTRLLGMEVSMNPEEIPLALLQPPLSIAWADLPGGWTVLSTYPAPVLRYLSRGGAARRLTGEERVAARIQSDLAGAPAFAVLRAEGSFLALYNTVVDLASALAPFAGGTLTPFGVDPARLPPGEKFLRGLKDHWVRVESGPNGLVIHVGESSAGR